MARKKTVKRQTPVPRLNPKNGPPVYFPTEPGTIPEDVLIEAVHAVMEKQGILHPSIVAERQKSRS
ncbi:MAG TPA: hypothetical protein VGQ36_12635 [Thermoanaerobaculia bacterium]|nr:hypothetical protein [Thermoanaerobaculia bacterium]